MFLSETHYKLDKRNQQESSIQTKTSSPWLLQVPSSCSSSRTRARWTTRASRNSQAAGKYFFRSMSRHKCSGASKSNFICAESSCSVCKCVSTANFELRCPAQTPQRETSPSFPCTEGRLGKGGASCARITSFVSSKASITRFDERAMEMMDVEACKRSRYRSLRFHGDSLNTLYPPINGYYAPNH